MVGGVGLGGLGFKRWWWGSERAKANRGSHSEGRGGGERRGGGWAIPEEVARGRGGGGGAGAWGGSVWEGGGDGWGIEWGGKSGKLVPS